MRSRLIFLAKERDRISHNPWEWDRDRLLLLLRLLLRLGLRFFGLLLTRFWRCKDDKREANKRKWYDTKISLQTYVIYIYINAKADKWTSIIEHFTLVNFYTPIWILLTDGNGDLDLDRDLQKFQKQPNLISTCTFLYNFDPRALMPLPRQSTTMKIDKTRKPIYL